MIKTDKTGATSGEYGGSYPPDVEPTDFQLCVEPPILMKESFKFLGLLS